MEAITEISGSGATDRLTPAEKVQVARLQARDREVRTHEAAHLAAAGMLARGGIQFEYQIGPDGKAYAVGGKVKIDMSPGRTPEETLAKARQIQSAAGAPSDPSGADSAVTASAGRLEAEALQELAERANALRSEGKSAWPSFKKGFEAAA